MWFPDWPVQAARLENKAGPGPVVITSRFRVVVCDPEARAAGIKRGMRVRQAQALCAEVAAVDLDEERDARTFTGLVEDLADVVPSIEILRPGLVVLNAAAAARFYGSEDRAAEKLINAAARAGSDCLVGIADEIPTAVLAAREQKIVPKGKSLVFLASLPLVMLRHEVALGCAPEVVDTLYDLGVRTLGDLANLPKHTVVTRFGDEGMRCYEIASAHDDRLVAPPIEGEDFSVWIRPEDPITRVDEAAFIARALASQLHETLRARGLVCYRLRVHASGNEATATRTWHTRTQLDEKAMADRVRWQLDAWLASGGVGAINELGLEPVECAQPAARSLWGAQASDEAQRVIARVQSSLGISAVKTPVVVGGRGVRERIDLIDYGESVDVQARRARGRWLGKIPPPLPARLGDGAAKVNLRASAAAGGMTVYVTSEAVLNADPAIAEIDHERFDVIGWAGPWPVDDGWWQGKAAVARLQVVAVDKQNRPRAWLLLWAGRWEVEAEFE